MGLASFNRMRRQQAEQKAKEKNPLNAVSTPPTEDASTKANRLVRNLSNIGAEDVRFLAKYLKIEYTNKEETISAIKAHIGR